MLLPTRAVHPRCTGQRCHSALVRCGQLPLSALCHAAQVAELAPKSCRGVERAVPFLTADEGIGSRVVLETIDSAITGCAHTSIGRRYLCARNAGLCLSARQSTHHVHQLMRCC